MADEHQRYERLAVGHVVGGLDEVDAARFRSHLVSCRDCRSRVAELRSIASDLVATEREERAARSTTGDTEVAERVEEEAPPTQRDVAPVSSWPWRVLAIGLVPLILLTVLAWAVFVRAENDLLRAAVETQSRALELLASGDQLDLEAEDGVGGVAAATSEQVVVDLVDIPPVGPNELVVTVLRDGAGAVVAEGTSYVASELEAGRLLDVIARGGAEARTVAVVQRRVDGDGTETDYDLATAPLPAP